MLEVERQKAENEIKLKHVEHLYEMELLELKLKGGVSVVEKSVQKPKGPKIPPFEEGKDEMDSYLHRFERHGPKLEQRSMGHTFQCPSKR